MQKSLLAVCLASFSSLLSVGSASALTLSLTSGVLPSGGATDQGTFSSDSQVKTVTFDQADIDNGYGNNAITPFGGGFERITKTLGTTTVTLTAATGVLSGANRGIVAGINDINANEGFAPPGPVDTKINQPNYSPSDSGFLYNSITQRNLSNFIALQPPAGGGNSNQIDIGFSKGLEFFGISLGFFDTGNAIIINRTIGGTPSTVTYGNGGLSLSPLVNEGAAYISFTADNVADEIITGITLKQTNPGFDQVFEIDNLGFKATTIPFDFEPSLSFLALGGIYGWYRFKNRKQVNK